MRRIGRRMFLLGSGSALGIPFLGSLLPRSSRAQTASAPRRFVAIKSYSGQVAKDWYPTSTPTGYRLRDAVFSDADKADGTTYLSTRVPNTTKHSWAPLTDFAATGVSQVLGTRLNPFLAKMNLLRGLDFLAGAGHNDGGTFGNYAAATNATVRNLSAMPTIDRVLAYSNAFYSAPPTLRALDVGTGSPNGFSFTNYGNPTGPVEQISFLLDPRAAWERAFSGFNPSPTPRVNPNVALLNSVHEDYRRVSTHRRLSAQDKQLLERHMTFLSEIERRLASQSSGLACTVPTQPRSIPNGYPWAEVSSIAEFQESVRLLVDIAAAALRCDVTRIITFDVQKAIVDLGGTQRVSFHNSADVAGDWHQFAHDLDGDANAHTNFVAISRWVANEVFGRFLEQLDVPEANGKTFLDNSLVCWSNELGYSHYNTDIPTVMAGSAGGALRTGYYVDYIDWSGAYANPIGGWGVLIPGLPHNRWLVTVLQAMGLKPADYETGGRAGYGHHEYIDTPYAWPNNYDLTQVGNPLPGIFI